MTTRSDQGSHASAVQAGSRPIAVDLFAGAGGLSEGFIQAAFFVVLAVEHDPGAAATYERNHTRRKSKYRTEVLKEDVSTMNFVEVARRVKERFGRLPDIVIGGPPCQGFSRANMRTRNSENPANGMAVHFVRAVAALKPRMVVLENVADVETFEEGHFVNGLLKAFNDIGYEAEYSILNAADFGVPQRRRRIFVIAARDGLQIEFPRPTTLFDDRVTVWDAISDLPDVQNGNTTDVMEYGKKDGLTDYQTMMRRRTNGTVRNNLVSRNSDLVVKRYGHIPQGGNWANIPDDLMTNYKDKSRCHHWIYLRLRENEPSVAITHFRKSMLIHPKHDRGLSVREAARIQSFPDHFVFQGTIGSQQQQVANAVPPLLARAVARCVRKSLGA